MSSNTFPYFTTRLHINKSTIRIFYKVSKLQSNCCNIELVNKLLIIVDDLQYLKNSNNTKTKAYGLAIYLVINEKRSIIKTKKMRKSDKFIAANI